MPAGSLDSRRSLDQEVILQIVSSKFPDDHQGVPKLRHKEIKIE